MRRIDGDIAGELVRALTNDRAGRVSAADLKRIRETTLNKIGASERPEEALEAARPTLDALAKLPMTEANRTALGRLETAATQAVARRHAELAGPRPVPAQLVARVHQALEYSLGAIGDARVIGSTVQAGVTFVDLDTPRGLRARVTLEDGPEGPELGQVRIEARPPGFDPALKAELERTLARSFGVNATVLGASSEPMDGGGLRHHLLAREPGERGGLVLWALDIGPAGLGLGSWVHDTERLREIALPAMIEQVMPLAREIGANAELEVHLRAAGRTPASLEEVLDPEESAVGIQPGETQLFLPSVLGPVGVYLTVERDTGRARLEDYN